MSPDLTTLFLKKPQNKHKTKQNKTNKKQNKTNAVPILLSLSQLVLGDSTSSALIPAILGAFAYSAMGRRIDPSWGGPIELFLVPGSATCLV